VLRDVGLQHQVSGQVFLDLARHVQNSWLDANDADLATLHAKLQHRQAQQQQQQQQTAAQKKALAGGKVLAEHLCNNHSQLLGREVQQQLGTLVFVPATLGILGGRSQPLCAAWLLGPPPPHTHPTHTHTPHC
jgi:hypothetical protein